MKIEERMSEMMNGIEVPDELSPQNIAVMLREKSAASKMESEHRNIASASNVSAKRRTIIMKTCAAAAACAVFAAGMWIYRSDMDEPEPIDARITYEATTPESYDEFYKIYTGITLNGINAPDSEKTVEDDSAETEDPSAYDFLDAGIGEIKGADVVKRYGSCLYCLKDKTIHIISLDTMEEISQVECPLEPPFEFYVEDGKIILISKEKQDAAADENSAETDTDGGQPEDKENSGSSDIMLSSEKTSGKSAIPASLTDNAIRTNAAVTVYDVSDPASPVRAASFKQNGRYVSSKLTGGVLYIVTAYSNYRVKPLDTIADLDSFVPAYYIDGEKKYLAANDIMILPDASSTAYAVVSAIDINSGLKSVKAVLGADKYIYCSDSALYAACPGVRDGKNYSVIYSFDLSDGQIKYRSSGSVEGALLDRRSMNEYDGKLRAAAVINDGGEKSVSVYVLDKSLTVVNSAGRLFAGQEVSSVRFEKNYARIFGSGENSAVTVLDLSSSPPVIAGSMTENCLYGYSDGMLMGVGKAQSGISLTMYADTGLALNGTVIGGSGELTSPALSDRRSVLIDNENGIIGIPASSASEFGTKNSYFVYSYDDEAGFTQKGVIEYVDVDDSMEFKRAYTSDGVLYIVSSGRVISARLSDLKVISVYNIK